MQWNIFYVLIAVNLIYAQELCDDKAIIINGIKYEEEILKDGLDSELRQRPFQLNVDYKTNILFYTFDNFEDDDAMLSTAYLYLNNGTQEIIPGLYGGVGTAVDNKNHVIYLSSKNEGIYTYDPISKELKYVVANGTNVHMMFFKDRLYYTIFDSDNAFVYENGESRTINSPEKVEMLSWSYIGVDKHENIWIGNGVDELFCYIKQESKVVLVGKYNVCGFASDTKGNLYFAAIDGVYSIGDDRSVKRIFNPVEIYGLAFDGDDNIIYSDKTRIIRLKSSGVNCTTL